MAWHGNDEENALEKLRHRLEQVGMSHVRELERLVAPSMRDDGQPPLTEKDVEITPVGNGIVIEKGMERPGYFGPNAGEIAPYATQPGLADTFGSKQLHDDLFQIVWNQIIEPPIDLRLWASQLNRNTRLIRAVRSIARNTVGMGWEMVPAQPLDDDTPPDERAAIEKEIEIASEFFENCNTELPLASVLELQAMDEEACGNGYLEFVEDNTGRIQRIFHVPAITVRLLRNERGFVQIRGTRRRYFKKFGDPKVMDAETGAFVPEESEGPLPPDKRASALLHFSIYSPTSEFYGIPRWLPAATAVAGNALSAKRNLVFFKNDAVPRSIVAVSGGTLSEESKADLARYFDEGKGAEAAHRLLLLQTTLEGLGVDEKSTVKIDVKPLTVGVGEDASFLKYRKANDEEIREALGLSEVFFTSGALAKASAVIAKAMTDEQELEPIRRLKEHLINHKVVKGSLNLQRVRFRFLRPQVADSLEKARIDADYVKTGVLTPNEVRHRSLGLDPYPASLGFGHEPLPLANQKQSLRLAVIQNSLNLAATNPEAVTQALDSSIGDGATDPAESQPDGQDDEEPLSTTAATVRANSHSSQKPKKLPPTKPPVKPPVPGQNGNGQERPDQKK